MGDIDRLFQDPNGFLESYRASTQAQRNLMRRAAARVEVQMIRDPDNSEPLEAVKLLATWSQEDCCISLAHSLAASFDRRHGRFDDAARAYGLASLHGLHCPYCCANLLRRRGVLARHRAFCGVKDYSHSMSLLTRAQNLIESLLTAVEAKMAPSKSLIERVGLDEAKTFATKRLSGSPDSATALQAALAEVLGQLGKTVGSIGDLEYSRRLFEHAMELSLPPDEKSFAKRYTWWARIVACPSLPTAEQRDLTHDAAFINYAMALSMSLDDSKAQAKAAQMVQELKNRKGLPDEKRARVLWMSGMLRSNAWLQAETKTERRDLARGAEADFRGALKKLRKNGLPSDVVACLCDAVRSPWIDNPGAYIEGHLNNRLDPKQSSELMEHLSHMDPSVHERLVAVTEQEPGDARHALAAVRSDVGGRLPSLLAA